MITSTRNPKIKWVRSLQAQRRSRQEAGAFVVEGMRLVEEALASGWIAQLVLFTAELPARGKALVEAFRAQGVQVEEVREHVMRAASDTETPQGILAVLTMKELPVPRPLDFALLADGVRDPGNLGAILRTAAAAGVQAVLLPPGGVDAFSPKVVRAAMGAHFRLPVRACSWDEIRAALVGLRVYLAATDGGIVYYQADFQPPLALVIGSEAQGASSQARRLATAQVRIPMPGGSESLNVAVAAGVLTFEVVRQRGMEDSASG